MYVHDLKGCAPTPLAHYLKALGILRLVSEQADPEARGWWHGDLFRLATKLDAKELEAFFLELYEPTPILSPWNKGSGFFYANDPGLTPLEESKAARFAAYRDAIAQSRDLLAEMSEADAAVREIKKETKIKGMSKAQRERLKKDPDYKKRLAEAERRFKNAKADLIPRCRLFWRDCRREWMDAAMVLDSQGEPVFPALLGTGGNDGRLDFTNNFMQYLNEVFDLADFTGLAREAGKKWSAGSIWGDAVEGCLGGAAVGQYLPGTAGGANNTTGPVGYSLLNPVDFLLMLEGTVLFTAHASRRHATTTKAAVPFAFSLHGVGYSSSSNTGESARGEQWMPLWSQPMKLYELKRLLAEGRAQIGFRTAKEPLDMARAIGRFGISRGISAFQRFGYIERNGQSNLAVPLDRFPVRDQVAPQLACLDDLDVWMIRLRREARGQHAPHRLKIAEHVLGESLFAVVQRPEVPELWQNVLCALSSVEAVMVTGNGFRAGPIPPLRPEWVTAADDGSVEFRLALTFALQAADYEAEPVDGVRRHWLPLKGSRFATAGDGSQARLEKKSDLVLSGRSGLEDAIALVRRRLIEAVQKGGRRFPLVPAPEAGAHSTDLSLLLSGRVNLDHTLELARALMAINLKKWSRKPCPPVRPVHVDYPDDAWLAIRLSLLPETLLVGRSIGIDPAIFRRLESGDAASAFLLAQRRLRAAGIGTTMVSSVVSPMTARLWAAALAFPINRKTAERFVRRLHPNAI